MTYADDRLWSGCSMSVFAQTGTFAEHFRKRALEVFSNNGKADRWLRCEIPALQYQKPIDLIATKEGRDLVEAELVRIESGTY